MSPTVRHDPADAAIVDVPAAGVPTRVVWYACSLLAGALVAGVVLLAAGSALPQPGPVLLLAIPLALCMNRFVFFPNEVGVTADAAVLVAAIVGFRHDAVWLGPLVLALLAGPLDAKHWEERAFVRMAFNSGSTALVALAGVAMFVPASELLGGSAVAVVGAALVAVVPYVAVESLLGIALVVLQGDTIGAAARHQLPVNTIAVPLAAAGAVAGLLALPLGWWSTALVLLPAAFVPEWALVSWRRRRRGARGAGVASALVALAIVALVASTTTPSSAPTLVVLAAGAVVLALDLVVDRRFAVPPMVAVMVAASAVVSASTCRVAVSAAVAALATAVAWATARDAAPASAALRGVCGAAAAGAAGAFVFDVAERSGRMLPAALLAGAACALIAVLVDGSRRQRAVRVLWAAPLVAVSAALAVVWRLTSDGVGVVCTVGAGLAVAAACGWGAAPWASRRLGVWGARRSPRWRRVALGTAGLVAVGAALAAVAGPASGAPAAAYLGVAAAEAEVGMALLAVRQWRFAPRPRAFQTAILGAATLLLVAVAGPFAADGGVGGLVAIVAVVIVAATMATPLGDVASGATQRKPESRSASR